MFYCSKLCHIFVKEISPIAFMVTFALNFHQQRNSFDFLLINWIKKYFEKQISNVQNSSMLIKDKVHRYDFLLVQNVLFKELQMTMLRGKRQSWSVCWRWTILFVLLRKISMDCKGENPLNEIFFTYSNQIQCFISGLV